MSYMDMNTWFPDGIDKIVTICGSTKQRQEINELNRRLTMQGKIVLAPGVFGHDGYPITEEEKRDLDILHLKKIDLAEEVNFIMKPDGTFGTSTQEEYRYAIHRAKKVRVFRSQELLEAASDLGTPGFRKVKSSEPL